MLRVIFRPIIFYVIILSVILLSVVRTSVVAPLKDEVNRIIAILRGSMSTDELINKLARLAKREKIIWRKEIKLKCLVQGGQLYLPFPSSRIPWFLLSKTHYMLNNINFEIPNDSCIECLLHCQALELFGRMMVASFLLHRTY
jgi:hypothetical protein